MCQCVIVVIGSPGLQRLGAVSDDPGVLGVDHAGVVLLLVHVVDHVPLHPLHRSVTILPEQRNVKTIQLLELERKVREDFTITEISLLKTLRTLLR